MYNIFLLSAYSFNIIPNEKNIYKTQNSFNRPLLSGKIRGNVSRAESLDIILLLLIIHGADNINVFLHNLYACPALCMYNVHYTLNGLKDDCIIANLNGL